MSHPINNNKPVPHTGIQPPKIQKDHRMLLGAEAASEALGDTWKGEGFAQPVAVRGGQWLGGLDSRDVARHSKQPGARKASQVVHKFFAHSRKTH